MNEPPPLPPAGKSRDRAMLPVVVSTGVFPGVGQFLQGRWLAGTVLTLLFLSAVALVVWRVWVFYHVWRESYLAQDGLPSPDLMPAALACFGALAALFAVHGLIIADVWHHARRAPRPPPE